CLFYPETSGPCPVPCQMLSHRHLCRQSTELSVECLHYENSTGLPAGIPPGNIRPFDFANSAVWSLAWPRDRKRDQEDIRRSAAGGNGISISRIAPAGGATMDYPSWETSDKGKRAKYYRLTPAGKK